VGDDPALWLPRFREATAKGATRTANVRVSEKRVAVV
jgi:hypothetical protein